MCRVCEGFSQEDELLLTAATIAEYGYMVMGVGAASGDPPGGPEWAYTVGLLDRADHPELIVAGPEFVSTGALLNEIGRSILAGPRYAVGDTFRSSSGVVRFGAVDPIQYRLGTFNVWHDLERMGLLHVGPLEALQVFAPPEWLCAGHRDRQPVLSDPSSRVDAPVALPNRAARRARRR